MKMHLIYPSWPKLERQTKFHLPPHGPVVFAAAVPPEVDLHFTDDNLQPIDFDAQVDLVGVSVMLSCQLPRAFQIADTFRAKGVKVVMGGIAVMLHAKECELHADAVFLGEAEGRFPAVLEDLKAGKLKKVYDHMKDLPDASVVGIARRSILNRELYNYRGVQMLDLVHASRGCKFNCAPCCSEFLGGRNFRPRPVSKAIEEMESIKNNRLFIVDNSLAQDKNWLRELFTAMVPLRKTWVSHPILDDDEILKLAAASGCWYVYQAIFDTSNHIRNRIKRLKDHGIAIEGTIILGTDDQDEDYIKRLVDFLLEVKLDMAEFTIMTPFPHSTTRAKWEKEGRVTSNNWLDYTADKVVFKPKRMTAEKLQEMYHYAWDRFYQGSGHSTKMGMLFKQAMVKEMTAGTYRRFEPENRVAWRG